jgi:2-dehydropantoate 2-reductase
MKICVVGLGAIGGWMAARLANSGAHVSAIARGETLAAVRAHGLTLRTADGETRAQIKASDGPRDLPTPDVLILATKTTALAQIVPTAQALCGAHTTIVSAMNGVPWWFFGRADRPFANEPIRAVDADGALLRAFPPARVVGCVVHASSTIAAPAVVAHRMGNRLIFGEAVGGASARLSDIAACFRTAKFDVEETPDIQRELWYKLWGNMTMNPVSALTGATMDVLLDDPHVRAYVSRIMVEANAVGEKLGVPIHQSPEDRHVVTRKLGAVRTSMLQDVDAGRAIELGALLTAVVEMGERLNVPMPNAQSLLGLTRVMARVRGLH